MMIMMMMDDDDNDDDGDDNNNDDDDDDPCKHALTEPELKRCQWHRPGTNPVKAHYGIFHEI